MANNFSLFEVLMIKDLISNKSDNDIADMLNRPVHEVTGKIHELTGGANPYHEKQLQKKKEQERRAEVVRLKKDRQQAKKDWESKKRTSTSIIAQQNAERQRARRKREEPKFATKQIDLSQLIAVRIDHKTTIFIKPGEDPFQAKIKYFDRLREGKSRMLIPEKDPEKWNKVAKFKV